MLNVTRQKRFCHVGIIFVELIVSLFFCTNIMKIGIIGAGFIAGKMASTLLSHPDGCEVYAVASRSMNKAQQFALEWNIPIAMDSYNELVRCSEVDLVYIATPHSHHFEHARMAIMHGKPCLVEKAFTANAREAAELIELARKKRVFLAEAIWTRYMPMSHKIKEVMDSGIIGEPRVLTATLCYEMLHKERILRPELCGGALLDLGVYVLNFARMYFGPNYERCVTNCLIGETGVDMHESISLTYSGGRIANLQAGALCQNDRQGIISGTEGYIRVNNVNCPTFIEVFRADELVASYSAPVSQISGYEYQIFECKRCIDAGLLESPFMPHAETLAVMQQMDALRREWGVCYPMD